MCFVCRRRWLRLNSKVWLRLCVEIFPFLEYMLRRGMFSRFQDEALIYSVWFLGILGLMFGG